MSYKSLEPPGQKYCPAHDKGLTLYFFKIARLDGCAIVELPIKLSKVFGDFHEAFATKDGSKGIKFLNKIFFIKLFKKNKENNFSFLFIKNVRADTPKQNS